MLLKCVSMLWGVGCGGERGCQTFSSQTGNSGSIAFFVLLLLLGENVEKWKVVF